MTHKRVLVVGHRPAIAVRLAALEVPFVVWHDRAIKKRSLPGCERRVENEPFAQSVPKIKERLDALFAEGVEFSHVIAGTEASVLTASVARRTFGARRSKDTVVQRCHDKRAMKMFLREAGVPLIPFLYAREHRDLSDEEVVERLGLPLVVKQLHASGGRGLHIVRAVDELAPFRSQRVLFESYVDAPEMSVETLIVDGDPRFISTTRYVEKTWTNLVPSGLDAPTLDRVLAVHAQVQEALRIPWGLTHAEFYLAGDTVYFGEIALRPPGGYIMELIGLAHDVDAWAAFVDNELEIEVALPDAPVAWAASASFHPGGGVLESIEGREVIEANPACVKLHLHAKVGDTIGDREGVGDATAFALFRADSKRAALRAATSARTTLRYGLG